MIENPSVPYRGIEYYRYVDHPIFFARQTETLELLRSVVIYKGVLLFGSSGAGKSSLINADLIPEIMAQGFSADRIRVQNSLDEEIIVERISSADDGKAPFLSPSFADACGDTGSSRVVLSLAQFKNKIYTYANQARPLLIFDQFEEIITLFEETSHSKGTLTDALALQEKIINTLVELLHDDSLRIKILFAFREDYLAKLTKLFLLAPELPNQYQRLTLPQKRSLRDIIAGPLKDELRENYERQQNFSKGLIDRLVEEFTNRSEGDAINLSEVQIVCLGLWEATEPDALFKLRGVQGLLEDCLTRELGEFSEEQRSIAIGLLSYMLTASNTRNIISGIDLIRRFQREQDVPEEQLKATLRALTQTRLVRRELRYEKFYFYEIASEYIVPWIIEQKMAREADIERRKLLIEKRQELEHQRLEDRAKAATKFKLLTAALALFGIIALGLAWVAKSESKNAASQKETADQQRVLADASARDAKTQAAIALSNAVEANKQTKLAEDLRIKAENLAKEASYQTKLAQAKEVEAREQTALAEALRIKAEGLAKDAKASELLAKDQTKLADDLRIKAENSAQEARVSEAKAKEQTALAEGLREKAELSAREAEVQKQHALNSQKETEVQRMKADQAAKDALIQAAEANKQRDEANKQRELAEDRLRKLRDQSEVVAGLIGEKVTIQPSAPKSRTGKLKLRMLDVYGTPLKDKASVILRNQIVSSDVINIRDVDASLGAPIEGLLTFPRGVYNVEIGPSSYQSQAKFVTIKPSGITELSCTFPVDAAKVRVVDFPQFNQLPADAQELLGNSGNVVVFEGRAGRDLYNNFDDIRKAGLLNIIAKARATSLVGGRNVLQFIKELKEVRGDRVFASVAKELREEVKGTFAPVDASLYRAPPGFEQAGSFRTKDSYGSLQITFFVKGEDYVADIDIDDQGGLGHIFQVNKSLITGRPTHPYDIHEILVMYQQIDPGYHLGP
jgi:hypothetical protein